MKGLKVSLLAISFILASCSSLSQSNRPSQAQMDARNQYCYSQLEKDKISNTRKWFTSWLKCKKQYIMPLEMALYPGKEQEIRAMYDKLIDMGAYVDYGITKVEPVYEEWDRMQAEIGIYKGVCTKNPDGSQHCINPKGSVIFIKNNGRLTPYISQE